MAIHPYFTALLACIITLLFISSLSPIAHKINLVDQPDVRKQHQGRVPLIGGIAIAAGFSISILALNISLSPFRALLAGFLLLTIIGLMDDFNEISAFARIVAQAIVGLLVACWGHVLLAQLGPLFFITDASFNMGLWAIPLTILCVMAMINATNMLDGMDGLAGGTSFVSLMCLYWIARCSDAIAASQLLLIISSCLLGFLYFNLPIAQHKKRLVFLGDAGSTALGLIMAWFAIQLSQPPFNFLKPAYLVWLFILPIIDLTSVTLRRLLVKHVSAFTADREHLHHLLQSMGLPAPLVTLCLILVALLGGLIAIFMAQYHFSESLAVGLFIFLFLSYFVYATFYWHKK